MTDEQQVTLSVQKQTTNKTSLFFISDQFVGFVASISHPSIANVTSGIFGTSPCSMSKLWL
jgi:hypothetical protein